MIRNEVDILLIGGGIMSATLGILLNQLNPEYRITMIERLSDVALESSDALNNAGTGHAGYCELNYTPQSESGEVNIEKALSINANFETSLQLWSSLVERGILPKPENFIHQTPHLSFVWGEDNVAFLKQRYNLLKQHHLFEDMQFSDDVRTLESWMPLIMQNRLGDKPMAATYVKHGADVDFGAITRHFVSFLRKQEHFTLLTDTSVKQIKKLQKSPADNSWHVQLHHRATAKRQTIKADFVFIGAGGGTLPLLQKTEIKEGIGYGGFPVSGQWLICQNPEIIKQHHAKVYGKAPVGAPPMSVPHLDTRIIGSKPALLFGPFAGFTTKFLKAGSKLDLAKSIKKNNFKAILGVSKKHTDLTKYLLKEATQSHEQRMKSLRTFITNAKSTDWSLAQAGQRVQIIKQCNTEWGRLEFGTEIVSAQDGSLAALLGASPGASVSAKAMLDVIECCFQKELTQESWVNQLKQLIPAYGQSLIDDADLLRSIRQHTHKTLQLL